MIETDTDFVSIPQSLYDDLVEASCAFNKEEGNREQNKERISEEISENDSSVLPKAKDASDKITTDEKIRFNKIGEKIFTSGINVVEKVTAKERLKVAMRRTFNFITAPVKVAKKAIDHLRKSPLFRIIMKFAAVLTLGYLIWSGFFDKYDEEFKKMFQNSLVFLKEDMIPWITNTMANLYTTSYEFVASATNSVMEFVNAETFNDNIRNAIDNAFFHIESYFYDAKRSTGAVSIDAMAANRIAELGDEKFQNNEDISKSYREERKKQSVVAKQLLKDSDLDKILHLIYKKDYDKKVQELKGPDFMRRVIKTNELFDSDISSPAGMSTEVINFSKLIEDAITSKIENNATKNAIAQRGILYLLEQSQQALIKATMDKNHALTEEQKELLKVMDAILSLSEDDTMMDIFTKRNNLLEWLYGVQEAIESAQDIAKYDNPSYKKPQVADKTTREVLGFLDDVNEFLENSLKKSEDAQTMSYSPNKAIVEKFKEQHKKVTGERTLDSFFMDIFKPEVLVKTFNVVFDELAEKIKSFTIQTPEAIESTTIHTEATDNTRTSVTLTEKTSSLSEMSKETIRDVALSIREKIVSVLEKTIELQDVILNNTSGN